MGDAGILVAAIDVAARESMLFAAIWFLVGGLDDLAVDVLYLLRRLRGRIRGAPEPALPDAVPPGRIAVFVPVWREERVIGAMLRRALAAFDHPDYRIYVGTYPNDPGTIRAVADVAAGDARVRLVIGDDPGPTTKAANLNAMWRAMLREEAAEGITVHAVVLHDAEDYVHPLELRVYADRLRGLDAVQIPVLPLRHRRSRWVSGHYCDEFAEAHAKQLLVRQAVGAGLPLAGVGCAIRREMLARVAAARGAPFDPASLTEDYELGLTIAAMGGRCRLVRVPEAPGGPPVAVRAYFPTTLHAAVRQKARWMTGIALAGWDRTGWARGRQIGDHWMRMRDRRATLEIPVLATAYCALLLWGLSLLGHAAATTQAPVPPPEVRWLLGLNLALLGWRVAVRAAIVRRAYGWREAALSVPRILVGNLIALLAARRALFDYLRMLAGGVPHWDKTEHEFPEAESAAA
ncbi:glycosyl transferase family protein [Sphingomonas canadensis]|uniref:Glycosyl transferase family protein n=1 Tax=Sphingomonas canadensis TaxID=1219257 RepID=A0ABW3H0H8_9SPHN|nr:glycosyl transferase family protein [Sphingomonas canadensis]MCW3835152.1 glycosyl transferase family protein [Sphingomonas canadensis]